MHAFATQHHISYLLSFLYVYTDILHGRDRKEARRRRQRVAHTEPAESKFDSQYSIHLYGNVILSSLSAISSLLFVWSWYCCRKEVQTMMSLVGWIMHGNEWNELDINIQSSFIQHFHLFFTPSSMSTSSRELIWSLSISIGNMQRSSNLSENLLFIHITKLLIIENRIDDITSNELWHISRLLVAKSGLKALWLEPRIDYIK